MKIWVVERLDDVDYDQAAGFVIVAADEAEARALAAAQSGGYEMPETWKNPATASCKPVDASGPARVILRDFNAG